jgi:hypothetical protein
MTLRNAPLSGRDGEICRADFGFGKTEIFLQEGLDTPQSERDLICPSGSRAPSRTDLEAVIARSQRVARMRAR